jgi:hypothetical protein
MMFTCCLTSVVKSNDVFVPGSSMLVKPRASQRKLLTNIPATCALSRMPARTSLWSGDSLGLSNSSICLIMLTMLR